MSNRKEENIGMLAIRLPLTFETHWSSRSTSVELQAPAAKTILSPWYFVPSAVSTPVHVVPSAANKGRLNVPALAFLLAKDKTETSCL